MLTRASGIDLCVVDVGVASPIPGAAGGEGAPRLLTRPVRKGTASFVRDAAMTRAEAERALAVGAELAA